MIQRASRMIAMKGEDDIFGVDVYSQAVGLVTVTFMPGPGTKYAAEIKISTGSEIQPANGESVIIYAWNGSTLKIDGGNESITLEQSNTQGIGILAGKGLQFGEIDSYWVKLKVSASFSGTLLMEAGPHSTRKTGKIRLPGN